MFYNCNAYILNCWGRKFVLFTPGILSAYLATLTQLNNENYKNFKFMNFVDSLNTKNVPK